MIVLESKSGENPVLESDSSTVTAETHTPRWPGSVLRWSQNVWCIVLFSREQVMYQWVLPGELMKSKVRLFEAFFFFFPSRSPK